MSLHGFEIAWPQPNHCVTAGVSIVCQRQNSCCEITDWECLEKPHNCVRAIWCSI